MSHSSSLRGPLWPFINYILRRPVFTLFCALLLTIVSIWLTSRMSIQSNFADLLPSDEPAVKELRHLEKIVGGASFVVLTVHTDRPELAPPFLDEVAVRLAHHPDIRYLDYRPPVAFFRKHALLYLQLPELKSFVERTERRIDQAKLQSLMFDFSEPGDEKITLEDFEAKYPQFFQTHDFYQSADGRLFVMLIKPNGRATDTVFTRRILTDVQSAIDGAKTNLTARHPEIATLHVQLTGPYVKAMAQNAIALQDAKRVAAISMVVMLGFLLCYFRRRRALVLIGIPLFMSVSWAMGSAYLCFGALNFFTALATAVLLGLSADFGVHLYSRYLDHRQSGLPPAEALRATYANLGLALWAAAITTVAGFMALTLSHFKAFYQFGLIIAIGMVHCLIAMYTVFPALTLLIARWKPERETRATGINAFQRIAERLAPMTMRPAIFVTGALLCLVALIPLCMGRVHFDYNFSNILGAQPTRALDARVDSIFTHTVNPEIARAASAEDAAAFAIAVRAAKVANATRPEGTTIQTAIALSDFVPADQPAKLALIGQLRAAFTETVLKSLTSEERQTYDRFAPALHAEPVQMRHVPPSVAIKFRDLLGNQGRFLFIFPNFDPANGRQFMQFVEELRGISCPTCQEPLTFSGESVIFYEIIQRMFHDGRWVIGASLLGVFLALFVAFRNVKRTIICFTPYIVGLLWMLGIMGAFRIPFTLINIAVIPILIGVAIDYPIYLFQQSLHFGSHRLPHVYGLVAPPIFGSATTTILGFGCLLIAQNGGARSFGLVAVIGLTTCTLATLLWFPSWLAWLEQRRVAKEQIVIEPELPQAAEVS